MLMFALVLSDPAPEFESGLNLGLNPPLPYLGWVGCPFGGNTSGIVIYFQL